MYSLLLAIIYIAFISLGLPDSLLGSAWPVMHQELDASLSSVGLVTIIISGGTIFSSLLSDRLTHRFGTGLVTAASVLLTALALFGFSISGRFWQLCLWAIPYGVGAGAVDAALNNYVALHYSSRHMSWLHCFWGVGTCISPYIMSYHLSGATGWIGGFRAVSIVQMVLALFFFASLSLWKRQSHAPAPNNSAAQPLSLRQTLKLDGVWLVLVTFFAYCALESTAGLWASSYLVQHRGIDTQRAARFASLFYIGITAGRFLSGFLSEKLGDRRMICLGISIQLFGIVFILLPLRTELPALAGLILVGLGCAPVYPSIIHATPDNFGRENSQAVIGIQMACAYLGSTMAPPLFGLIAQHIHIRLYPLYLLLFAVLMLLSSEALSRRKTQK